MRDVRWENNIGGETRGGRIRKVWTVLSDSLGLFSKRQTDNKIHTLLVFASRGLVILRMLQNESHGLP